MVWLRIKNYSFQAKDLLFSSDLQRSWTTSDEEVVYSEPMERWILRKYAWQANYDHDEVYATARWFRNQGYSPVSGDWGGSSRWMYDDDDLAWCEDIEEYIFMDDAYYCEYNDCCYAHEENAAPEPERHIVNQYHQSCQWNRDLRVTESLSSLGGVGFEIEKAFFQTSYGESRAPGDPVGEYDAFQGFETDSSCGVEAITNILPLDAIHFDKVRQLFDDAADVINSPLNNACGGHINVSYEGLSGGELMAKIRPNVGILYAMFPERLGNQYCRGNARLTPGGNTGGFPVARVYGGRIEFRLPNGVKNVDDLMLRHKIMSFLVTYSVQDGVNLLERIKPLVKEWFTIVSPERSIEEYMQQVDGFNDWIQTGNVRECINRYTAPTEEADLAQLRQVAMTRIREGNGRVTDFSLITDRQSDMLAGEGCDMSPNATDVSQDTMDNAADAIMASITSSGEITRAQRIRRIESLQQHTDVLVLHYRRVRQRS